MERITTLRLQDFNFRFYSREMKKLYMLYQQRHQAVEKVKKSSRNLGSFRLGLSLFQLLLVGYAATAVIRFLFIVYCQQNGCLESYYRFDVLMNGLNWRRNLTQFVHLCFAAFCAYTVYMYYLNYCSLNLKLTKTVNRMLEKRMAAIEQNRSESTISNVTKPKTKTKKSSFQSQNCFTERFLKAENFLFGVLYFLFGLVLISRVKQYLKIGRYLHLSPFKSVVLELDATMMILLNGNLMKTAIFEELTIWIVCSDFLNAFTSGNRLLSVLSRIDAQHHVADGRRLYLDLLAHFRKHIRQTTSLATFNRIKVSRSILAFLFTILPVNVHLLSSLLRLNFSALWVNMVMSVVMTTVILFTSTIPMIRVQRAAKSPTKYIDRLQINLVSVVGKIGVSGAGSGTFLVRHKLKVLNFYEYISVGKYMSFTVGSDGIIKSFNVLKFLLIYFGYIMNAILLQAKNWKESRIED